MSDNEHRDPALADIVRSAMRNLRHVEEELARDRRSMWAEDSEVVELRAAVAALEAKLAGAEKHADELAAHLRAINDKMWSDDEGDMAWADFQDLCEAAEPALKAHAARRAARDGQEGTR